MKNETYLEIREDTPVSPKAGGPHPQVIPSIERQGARIPLIEGQVSTRHVKGGFQDVLEALKEQDKRIDRMLWYMHSMPTVRVRRNIFTGLIDQRFVSE